MINLRWLLAVPVMLAAATFAAPATAADATIRDRGGMFSKEAVKKAEAVLDKVVHASGIPIVIETIDAIPDLEANAPTQQRRRAIDLLARERDRAIRDEGIYLLISKRDHVISHVLVRERLADALPIGKRDAIRDAFVEDFKHEGGYDAGLLNGARAIEKALEGVSVRGAGLAHGGGVARPQHRADGGRVPAGRSTMTTFFMIIVGIFGVLLVLRLIGGLFNRSAGQGFPGQAGMGMQRPGMGGGPGYGYGGGPGYGGRGGGFFSGMLGGLGGALPATGCTTSSSAAATVSTARLMQAPCPTRPPLPIRVVMPSSAPTTTPAGAPRGMTAAVAVVATLAVAIGAAVVTGAGAAAIGVAAAATGNEPMQRFQSRRDKLRAGWKAAELDALFVSATSNVSYLTGFTGDSSMLVVGKKRDLVISDGRFTTQLEQECPGLDACIRLPGEDMNPAIARVLTTMGLKHVGFEAAHCTVADQQALAGERWAWRWSA